MGNAATWYFLEPHSWFFQEVHHPFSISVHFEDAGTSLDDVGPPNYDPRNNGYWEEFLVDFGIREDPYSDYEEDWNYRPFNSPYWEKNMKNLKISFKGNTSLVYVSMFKEKQNKVAYLKLLHLSWPYNIRWIKTIIFNILVFCLIRKNGHFWLIRLNFILEERWKLKKFS